MTRDDDVTALREVESARSASRASTPRGTRVHIADAVNGTAISLEDAPRGYAELDAGAATKYVLDLHGFVLG